MTEAKRNERTSATALLAVKTAFGHAQTALAQAQARRDHVWERCAEEQIDIEQIAVAPADGDDALASPTLQTRIEQTCAKLPRMGTINPLAPQEYAEMHERYTFLTIRVDDVRRAADGLPSLISELEDAMNARFAHTFAAVSHEFTLAWTRLFGGGSAQLVLDDPDSGEGGIEIIAQPPGKCQHKLSLLSGGERSLTAVALLVARHD